MDTPLSAPLEIGFDYTRSLGPTLSRFMTALTEHRILGTRGSDGRVHVPPAEYDPVTFAPLTDLVEVSTEGTVVSWTWMAEPLEGQPLAHPFAWALIRLDGADTALLHAVDAGSPDRIRTGDRVRARWAPEPAGGIRDLACFEPLDSPAGPAPAPREVTTVISPVRLHYRHSASLAESRYLRALAEGRLLGQRCPVCRKVYVPPRGTCPTDGVATTEDVQLPDRGVVTAFCVVNVPFAGQGITPPYVAASVLLDGADLAFGHLILEIPAADVRMGMRVEAVWRPRAEWGTTPENISHFRPTGEPDEPFQS